MIQRRIKDCKYFCYLLLFLSTALYANELFLNNKDKPGIFKTEDVDVDKTAKHYYSVTSYENGKPVSKYTSNPDSVSRVIVIFKEQPADIKSFQLNSIENSHQQFIDLLDDLSNTLTIQNKKPVISPVIIYQYKTVLNGMALTAPQEIIERLPSLPMIESVHPDRSISACLDNSTRLVGADSARKVYHVSGKGTVVGIIDTGVDYTNPALGGGFGLDYRVIDGYDFIGKDPDPMDENGHGTYVAGIIGANGSELKGVAPEVDFLAVRVLDSEGKGYQSDAIAGIEFCMDPDKNIKTDDGADIINLSLGGLGNEHDPLSLAVDHASANGILCVVSAGNNGREDMLANYQSISSPGTAKTALTVGASTLNDKMYYMSSKGPTPNDCYIKPEIVAPGVGISSLSLNNSITRESGTSVSAPHVAGAAALLKEYHPNWTTGRLKSVIVHAAKRLPAPHDPYIEGNGRLAIFRAFQQRIIVEPAVLSFGRVDISQMIWSSEIPVTLTNPTDSPLTLEINVPGWPEYIDMTLEQTGFLLAPGETITTTAKLTATKRVPIPENRPYSYFADLVCVAGSDTFYIPCGFTKSPQLDVDFTLPVKSLLLWREDIVFGQLYNDLYDNISLYLDRGEYHVFCVMQQFIENKRHLYFVEKRNVDINNLSRIIIDHRDAVLQSQQINYDRNNRALTFEQLYRNRLALLFQHDYFHIKYGPNLRSEFKFRLDEEFKVNTTPLSDNFLFHQVKLYTPKNDRIVMLHRTNRHITSEQDIALPDGQYGLKSIAVNSNKKNNTGPEKYIMLSAAGLYAKQGATTVYELGLGILQEDFRPFNGLVDFSTAPPPGADDATCSSYRLTAAIEDTVNTCDIFISSPYFFVKPNGVLNTYYSEKYPGYWLANIKNRINLKFYHKDDTLSLSKIYNETLVPDFRLVLGKNYIYIEHPNRFIGGLHTNSGFYERTMPGFQSFQNYTLITLFNNNKRLVQFIYIKSFIENLQNNTGIDNKNRATALYVSSPYHIIGQCGYSQLILNENKIGNANESLSLLHFDARRNNEPAQRLRPGENNTLNFHIRNGDRFLKSARLEIVNLFGNSAELDLHYNGGLHYQTSLPDTLSPGFYGVKFSALDDIGNPLEFIANPAFYYDKGNSIPETYASLYLENYRPVDRENLTVKPNAANLFTFVFRNTGSHPADDIHFSFSDSTVLQIKPSDVKRRFVPGEKDSVALPVYITSNAPLDTLLRTQLVVSYSSNNKRLTQQFPLFFGVPTASTSLTEEQIKPVNDFVFKGNYPNPVLSRHITGGVTFEFELFKTKNVSLDIYDILGRHVKHIEKSGMPPGSHRLLWNKTDKNNKTVGSGLFLYRMRVDNETIKGKLLIMK